MPGTRTLVWSAIQPVLAGTAFDTGRDSAPTYDPDTAAQLIWCAATEDFVRRHPDVTAAVDVDHPDGCTDIVVDVDATGHLASASMECLDLDDGLVGLPIGQALPTLASRIAAILD